ncbi:hypothetical protein HAX54_009522 [Datura stramonium]|uniref:Uncharacterized protein n=1 Tax=Datura stramonium TaxID=4076 RepID=A0ABS8RZR3_DATST|nr:hypothetical protein [Datura stramonium]
MSPSVNTCQLAPHTACGKFASSVALGLGVLGLLAASRTLLRRSFGHQSSVTRSVKDSEHVRKFFAYVQLWAFDNDAVDFELSIKGFNFSNSDVGEPSHWRKMPPSYLPCPVCLVKSSRRNLVLMFVNASSRAQVQSVLCLEFVTLTAN